MKEKIQLTLEEYERITADMTAECEENNIQLFLILIFKKLGAELFGEKE